MIYVDEPKKYDTPLRNKVWSHMFSDECDQELHEMADRIGLSRSWFQSAPDKATAVWKRLKNHYDVTPRKRQLAIRYGAVQLDADEVMAQIRATMAAKPPEPFVLWSQADVRPDDDWPGLNDGDYWPDHFGY